MARQSYLEIANFICKFGEKKVFADLFDEVIVPAYQSNLHRKRRETSFFFLDVDDVELVAKDPNSRAIVGRLVKETELHRVQVFDASSGKLVPDERSLPTAPSSIFALLHNSHRLLYVREQSDSPSIAQFSGTSRVFIRRMHLNYINDEHATSKQQPGDRRITKKSLLTDIPIPDIEVVPIFSTESLATFVNRYKELQVMRIAIAETNNEVDNTEFFRQLRESKKETNSHKSVVEHRNPKGLKKSAVIDQLKPAAQGNALIKLRGVDGSGDKLIGNNENFNVRVPIAKTAANPIAVAKSLFAEFNKLVRKGVVTLGERSDKRKSSK